jgi:putative addiction module component (TIGR02574 family)
MADREILAREALTLPPEDRAYLADVLERSLDPGPFATPEIAAAWSEEINRRIAAYDRGETRAIDMDTSLSRIRQVLADRREARGT